MANWNEQVGRTTGNGERPARDPRRASSRFVRDPEPVEEADCRHQAPFDATKGHRVNERCPWCATGRMTIPARRLRANRKLDPWLCSTTWLSVGHRDTLIRRFLRGRYGLRSDHYLPLQNSQDRKPLDYRPAPESPEGTAMMPSADLLRRLLEAQHWQGRQAVEYEPGPSACARPSISSVPRLR